MARKYESAVILTGDASGAVRAIELTDDHLRQLNARQERNKATTNEWSGRWEAATGVFKGAALGLGAAAAGFTALAARQVQNTIQTDRQARALGVTTGQLQAMQYAASSVGLEQDKMGDILKDVSDKIGDAYANGGGEALEVIQNLGLSTEELVKMDPAQQFLTIGAALDKFQTQSERTTALEAIANDASLLSPLLENNAQGFRNLQSEAYDLNIALSDRDLETYREADRVIREATGATEGLFNTFIVGVASADLGPLNQSASELRAIVTDPAFHQAVADLAAAIGSLIAGAGRDLTQLKNEISSLGDGWTVALDEKLGIGDELDVATAKARRLKNELNFLENLQQGSALERGLKGYFSEESLGEDVIAKRQEYNAALEQSSQIMSGIAEAVVPASAAQASLSKTALDVASSIGKQDTVVRGTIKSFAERQAAIESEKGASKSAAKAAAEAEREHAQALKESAEAYARLYGELDPAGKAQAEYQETLAQLRLELVEGTKTQLEYYAAVSQAAITYNEASAEADEYAKRTKALLEQYDSTYRRAQDLDKAQRDLTKRYKASQITLGEYQRSMKAIGEEAKGLAKDSGGATRVFTDAWDDALDRFHKQGADTFTDFFDGGLKSASDFADGMKSIVSRLLGELSYMAAKNTIMVSLGLDGGSLGNVMGSGGTGAGGFSLSSLSSLARNGWDSVQNGFGSISWMGSSPTAYGGTGFANSATSGISQTGLWGGSTSNFSGLNGLASMGAGYAGSQIGTSVGSSLFGKDANSNYGAMAGGAIGTYFGGPVGSFAGSALGGMLDSAFGSGRKASATIASGTKDQDWSGNLNRTSAFGTFGITDKSVIGGDDLSDTLIALQAYENQLAAIMSPDQIEAVTDRLDGWSYKADSTSEALEKRYDQLVDGVKGVADKPLKMMLEKVAEIDDWDFDTRDTAFTAALQLDSIVNTLGGNVADYIKEKIENVSGSDFAARAEQVAADVNKYLAVQSAADQLGLNFDALSDGAVYAGRNLVDAAGGLDAFNASISGYYQNFYTEAERTERATDQLNDVIGEFGLSANSTREEFRAVVESLNLNTSSGRDAYLTLMDVQQSFSDLVPWANNAADSIRRLSDQERAQAKSTYVDTFGPLEFQIAEVRSELETAIGSFANLPTTVDEVRAERNRLSRERAFDERAIYESNSGLIKQYIDLLAKQEEQLRTTGDALNQYGMTQEEVDASKGTYVDVLAPLGFQISYVRDQLEDAIGSFSEIPTTLREAQLERNRLSTEGLYDERAQYQSNSDLISKYIGLLDQERSTKEQAAAAARENADAEQQRLDALNDRRTDLQIELLRAQGREEEALRIERQKSLGQMDEILRSDQRRIWALQDEAEAAREAAAISENRTGLQIELLRAQGKEEQAVRRERELELAALDSSLRPLQERVWAARDEAEALEEAARAQDEYQRKLESARDTLASFGRSVSDWLDELNGTSKGLGSPGDQLAATSSAYSEQLKLARSGDQDALSSITRYADRFLDAQTQWSGSGMQTQSLIDRLEREIGMLPDQLTPTDLIDDPVAKAISQQTKDLSRVIDQNGDGTISQLELQRAQNEGLLGYGADSVGFGRKQAEQLGKAKHDIFEIRQWLTGAGTEWNDYGGKDVFQRYGLDGSHANGLDNVPFDGYRAELHKGERVVTAAENPGVTAFLDGNIPAPPMMTSGAQPLDQRELIKAIEALDKRLASIEQHSAANVRIGQTGFSRMIEGQQSGNRSLKKLEDERRLEMSK